MLIEGGRFRVLGIHDQGERSDVRLDHPPSGIDKHGRAEALTVNVLVNGQTTDAHRGHGWIRRQLAADRIRQVWQRKMAGR